MPRRTKVGKGDEGSSGAEPESRRKKPIGIIAFDLCDSILRIAIGNASGKISFSERDSGLSSDELETTVQRLSSYRVLATKESQKQIEAVESLGLEVENIPRILAIYWSLRDRLRDEPYLVLSLGSDQTKAGLVVDGVLEGEEEDSSYLSLKGIWNTYVENNGLLKRVIESHQRGQPLFQEKAFQGFVSVLKTGEQLSVGPISFVPPFDLSASLEYVLRLFRSVDPDGVASTVIISDWGASYCNLPILLGEVYHDVLKPQQDQAFRQAVQGLVAYGLAEKQVIKKPVLKVRPSEISFSNIKKGDSASSVVTFENVGGGIVRAGLETTEAWVTIFPDKIVCQKGKEQTVTVSVNAAGFTPEQLYATEIKIVPSKGNNIETKGIRILAKTIDEPVVPLTPPRKVTAEEILHRDRAERDKVRQSVDKGEVVVSPRETVRESVTRPPTEILRSSGRVEITPKARDVEPIQSAVPKVRSVTPLIMAIVILALVVVAITTTIWFSVSKNDSNKKLSSNANTSTTTTPSTSRTETTQSPSGMVPLSGGTFQMGNDGGDEYERPQHAVTVSPFFMDRYEVTCEDYQKFITATGHRSPSGWLNRDYPTGAARSPVTGVDWYDATAYAQWAGKRLPTEEEWEFAARGTTGWRYPWGDDWRKDAANADGTTRGQLSNVGEHSNGASPFGMFDMVGNAWEWTASDLRAYPSGRLPSSPEGESKVIRGGSWREDRSQATTTYRGYLPTRGAEDYSATGFRCAKDIATSSN